MPRRPHPAKFGEYSERSKQRIKKRRRENGEFPTRESDSDSGTSDFDEESDQNDDHNDIETSMSAPGSNLNESTDESRMDNSTVNDDSDNDSTVSSRSSGFEEYRIQDFEEDEEEEGEDNDPVNPLRVANGLLDISGYEDGDWENQENEDPPLYEGAPLSVSQSVLSIMSFFLSHQLTGAALADLLDLINLHCIEPNRCIESLYKFKKYFQAHHFPLVKHYYCSQCFQKLYTKESVCEQNNSHKGVSYFVEIALQDQVRSLMARPGFYELLNYRFQRIKANANNYEDIYDGECYRKLSSEGEILSDRNNISFQWYSDGVKVFQSSKMQIWPLVFSINELEFCERIKPEFMLLGGLWFGLSKPVPELFLEPFHDCFTDLKDGIEVYVPSQPEPITVKAVVLYGVGDMPMKCCFLHLIQYNGRFGCAVCEIEGERVPSQDRPEEDENAAAEQDRRRQGRVQVYPFDPNIVLRTDETTREYAEQAVRSGNPVRGVKGPSAVIYMHVRDYVTSFGIDSMYCLWANVGPSLLNLWFDPVHHSEPYSMSTLVKVVDERLIKIAPPSFVHRFPRPMSDRAHWKSAENMYFFFLYSVSVLSDIMNPEYFSHFLILLKALFILHSRSISEDDLRVASQLLTEFVSRYQVLYGVRHMTINVHSLLHLPVMTKRFGPPPITSCFPHENLNGVLKNLIHGTRFVDSQICSAASTMACLPRLKSRFLLPDSEAFQFCEKMAHRSLRYKTTRVAPDLFRVGFSKLVEPLPPLIGNALDDGQIPYENCTLFNRLLKRKDLYVSESYTRAPKSNSSVVKYTIGNTRCFGKLRSFVEVRNPAWVNARHYAIVTRLNTIEPYVIGFMQQPLSFIRECTSEGITEAVDCRNLECVCFFNSFKTVNNEEKCLIVEPFDHAGVQ